MALVGEGQRPSTMQITWRAARLPLLLLMAIALWGIFVFRTLPDPAPGLLDFTQYWDAGTAISHHDSPYPASARRNSSAPYIMPPFFALMMVPLAMLPLPLANLAWYVLTLALLFASCAMTALLVRDLDPTAVSP